MQKKIQNLITQLELRPHPEGGFYKETYRSEGSLTTESGERNLSTAIYFLLTSENVSRFHRINSDEMWFFHEGSPLEIHLLDRSGYRTLKLGPADEDGHAPFQVVPAGAVFGSTVEEGGYYALVSCVVAPGFDFSDFKLFDTEELLAEYPQQEEIIRRLT